MNNSRSQKSPFSWIGILLIAVVINGCGLTEDTITISYAPQQNIEIIDGAESINVSVNLTDSRTVKSKISTKKTGYNGMGTYAIKADNDIASLVSNAIKDELRNRGFKLQSGNVVINTELNKFYNDFKIGRWSGTAASEVIMNVQIKNSSGIIMYAKTINGLHNEEGIQIMSGQNTKISIEKAMQIAIANLMEDDSFINTLLKKQK